MANPLDRDETPRSTGLRAIEDIAVETGVPANLLIAIGEQAGSADEALRVARQMAAEFGPRIQAGEDVQSIIRAEAPDYADQIIGRAREIGTQLYPEQMEAARVQAEAAAAQRREEQPGIIGDFGRAVAAGAVEGAGSAVQGAGVLADQPLALARDDESYTPGLVARAGEAVGDAARGAGERLRSGMSDASQQAMAESTPSGDVFDPSTWSMGDNPSARGYLMQFGQTLGSLVPVLATGLAGRAVGLGAAATTGGGAAVGGAQAAGDGAETAAQIVEEAYQQRGEDGRSRLATESPLFQQLVAGGASEDEAFAAVRDEASRFGAMFQAPIGAVSGGFMSGVARGAAPLVNRLPGGPLSRALQAGLATGAEEGISESAEGVAARVGARTGSGLDVDATEGTFGDFVLGAIGGGPVGAVSGAATPRRDDEEIQTGPGLVSPEPAAPGGGGRPQGGMPGTQPPSMGAENAVDPATGRDEMTGPLPRVRVQIRGEREAWDGEIIAQDENGIEVRDASGATFSIPRADIEAGEVDLTVLDDVAPPPAAAGVPSFQAEEPQPQPARDADATPLTTDDARRLVEALEARARRTGWDDDMVATRAQLQDAIERGTPLDPSITNSPALAITKRDGSPFGDEAAARRGLGRTGASLDSYDIVPVEGGYVARPKTGAAGAMPVLDGPAAGDDGAGPLRIDDAGAGRGVGPAVQPGAAGGVAGDPRGAPAGPADRGDVPDAAAPGEPSAALNEQQDEQRDEFGRPVSQWASREWIAASDEERAAFAARVNETIKAAPKLRKDPKFKANVLDQRFGDAHRESPVAVEIAQGYRDGIEGRDPDLIAISPSDRRDNAIEPYLMGYEAGRTGQPMQTITGQQMAPTLLRIMRERAAAPVDTSEAPSGEPQAALTPAEAPEAPAAKPARAPRAKAPSRVPLAQAIRKMGGIAPSRADPRSGDRTPTWMAGELRAAGITPRTHPYLFNSKGGADFDNISPGTFGPDDAQVFGVDDTGNYLDRQAVLDRLIAEVTGDSPTAFDLGEQAEADEARRSEAERDRVEAWEFEVTSEVERLGVRLNPGEKEAILSAVMRGTDVADAIHDALVRSALNTETEDVGSGEGSGADGAEAEALRDVPFGDEPVARKGQADPGGAAGSGPAPQRDAEAGRRGEGRGEDLQAGEEGQGRVSAPTAKFRGVDATSEQLENFITGRRQMIADWRRSQRGSSAQGRADLQSKIDSAETGIAEAERLIVRLSEPATEPGADGLPQGVIPGAERDAAQARQAQTDRQRAEIAARQQQSKMRRTGGNGGDAGPLFGDAPTDLFSQAPTAAKTPAVVEQPKTDIDRISERKHELARDIAADAERVSRFKHAAVRKTGRASSSKASINTEQIAKKYGLSAAGYSPLDYIIGLATLGTMNTPRAELYDAILDIIEQYVAVETAPQPDGSASRAETVAAAAAETDPNPTLAQAEAENYRTGKTQWNGLTLSIENAKGSMRRGVAGDGTEWSVKMPAHYGRILKTTGADGDHVDFYMGDNEASDFVLVVNQVDPETGAFDEHKLVLGAPGRAEALRIYRGGFSDGSGDRRIGSFTETNVASLKSWLEPDVVAKPTAPITMPFDPEAGKRRVKDAAAKAKIGDFGEKIGGARKDKWGSFADRMAEAENFDIAKDPLSKTWPEPDYQGLLAEGVDAWAVGFVRAARDAIPRKPSKTWKVEQWAKQVETLRRFARDVLAGGYDREAIEAKLQVGRSLQRVANAVTLYETFGHEKSLKGLEFSANNYHVYRGQAYPGGKVFWEISKEAKATAFSNMPRVLASAETKAEAIEAFRSVYAKMTENGDTKDQAKADKRAKFIIWTQRGKAADGYFVGTKIGSNHITLRSGVRDIKEARRIIAEEADQLQAQLDKMRDIPNERRDENLPRVGVDHRGGVDVTPESFMEAFGFRGVEFGNYVEGPRRQQDLNDAYDALMDLAGIIDVPSKALSLNGSLAMAFGARGSGGKNAAAAHYEPGKVVINLTKGQGRGSLAHEWFHAIDNYFAKARETQRGTYITDNTTPADQVPGIRPEVLRAFAAVRRAILETELKERSARLDQMRSKPYWGTGIEFHARAFESYVIAKLEDQGASNDYLANVVNGTAYAMLADLQGLGDAYPYLKPAEIEKVRPAFDALFQTIETRETDRGVEMFSRASPAGWGFADPGPEPTAEDMQALARDVTTEMRQHGLQDKIKAEVVRQMHRAAVYGNYTRTEGRIRVKADVDLDTIGVLRHEIIHALRDSTHWGRPYGLFTQAEWQGLVRAGRADKALTAQIEERYPDLGAAGRAEEVVAEMYRLWATKRDQRSGVAGAFEKMRAFFTAMANALRGRGFQSAALTMERIAAGGVGGRGPDGGTARDAARERFGAAPAEAESRIAARRPDGRFSSKAAEYSAALLGGGTITGARERGLLGQMMTDAMGGKSSRYSILALVPGEPLYQELAKGLGSARTYLKNKHAMSAMRNEKQAEAAAVMDEWRGFLMRNRKANDALMDLMHDATIAGLDPAAPFTTRKKRTGETQADFDAFVEMRRRGHAELVARWEKLPKKAQDIYRKVRDSYVAVAKLEREIIEQNVRDAMDITLKRARLAYEDELNRIDEDGLEGEERMEAEEKAAATFAAVKKRDGYGRASRLRSLRLMMEQNQVEAPYFPLLRHGQYFVTVKDKDGKIVSFTKAETEREQARVAAEARKDFPDHKVTTGLMGSTESAPEVDPTFVADVEEMIGAKIDDPEIMDAIWQRYLETLPDFSIRKSRLHRKGTPGFAKDAFRNFARQMFHSAHQLARLKHGMPMQMALEDAKREALRAEDPNRAMAVVNEMVLRHDWIMNPKTSAWSTWATSAAFVYYLGMTPAAALVNLSQTAIVGIPVLGAGFKKGGTLRASRQLMRALREFGTGRGAVENAKTLTTEERAAMREAYARGIVDKSQAHDLAGVSESGVEYSDIRHRMMVPISFFFHHAERLNREITFLAAYRMARDNGFDQTAAIDKAGEMTWKTHFNYESDSRPRLQQNDFMRVLTVFRNFQLNMLFRLFRDTHQAVKGKTPEERREARAQLFGITGMMMMSAGISGTWGYSLMMTLAGMFTPGADSDDLEKEMRNALVNTLGADVAGLVLNGVPGHLTGIDLTSRLGMPELWFRSPDRQLEGDDLYTYWAQQFLGAVPGIAQNVFRGVDLAAGGDVWRGAETAAPKFIRDLMRGVRYSQDGVTTLSGNTLLEALSPGDALTQAMGFTPAQVAERYDINRWMMNENTQIQNARSSLLTDIWRGIRDEGEISPSTLEEIAAFNRANPDYQIDGETIRRSISSRRRANDATVGGVRLNARIDARIRANAPIPIY